MPAQILPFYDAAGQALQEQQLASQDRERQRQGDLQQQQLTMQSRQMELQNQLEQARLAVDQQKQAAEMSLVPLRREILQGELQKNQMLMDQSPSEFAMHLERGRSDLLTAELLREQTKVETDFIPKKFALEQTKADVARKLNQDVVGQESLDYAVKKEKQLREFAELPRDVALAVAVSLRKSNIIDDETLAVIDTIAGRSQQTFEARLRRIDPRKADRLALVQKGLASSNPSDAKRAMAEWESYIELVHTVEDASEKADVTVAETTSKPWNPEKPPEVNDRWTPSDGILRSWNGEKWMPVSESQKVVR